MGLLDRFKEPTPPDKFFDVPENDEGAAVIEAWLTQSEATLFEIDDEGHIIYREDSEGDKHLWGYTDESQFIREYGISDQLAALSFSDLKGVFAENEELLYMWLNPHSDGAFFGRAFFED